MCHEPHKESAAPPPQEPAQRAQALPLLVRLASAPVHFYRRYISPLTPPSCRFTPTCSQYALDALSHWGVLKGAWLTLVRLLKCQPLHPGGYDPVIPPYEKNNPKT